LVAFVIGANLEAQGLDVGGVEIRLGQDVTTAVQRLSIYRVVYSPQSNFWSVTQPVAGRFEWLGHVEARDGKVTGISKGFTMTEPNDFSSAYTEALKEARRRGGEVCSVSNVEYTNGLVGGVETRCGRYVVSLLFAMRAPDGTWGSGSVSLQVRTPKDNGGQ
jgi:hypothetical protein